MNEHIDLFKFISILRKKWIWVLLASVIGLTVSYAVTEFVLTPRYASVTRMVVTRQYVDNQTVELNDIETNISLINTYRDIINDPIVLDEVRENLSFSISEDDLSESISLQIQNDSQVFGIRVTGDTPEQAAEMTNLIALTFQENVGSILNVDNVSILSPARPNPIAVSPRLLINVVIGTFLGLLSGMLLCLALFVLDKKIYEEETIPEMTGWINLGSITELDSKVKRVIEKEKKAEKRSAKLMGEETRHVS